MHLVADGSNSCHVSTSLVEDLSSRFPLIRLEIAPELEHGSKLKAEIELPDLVSGVELLVEQEGVDARRFPMSSSGAFSKYWET